MFTVNSSENFSIAFQLMHVMAWFKQLTGANSTGYMKGKLYD